MILIRQIKDVEKILAEDGYMIGFSLKKLFPTIYHKNFPNKVVPFVMIDFLEKNDNVGQAAQYLKNIYHQ